jgi:hypothetical protein
MSDSLAKIHQKKVALDTLKLHRTGAAIMGGMNHREAVEFLLESGMGEDAIKRQLRCYGHSDPDIDEFFGVGGPQIVTKQVCGHTAYFFCYDAAEGMSFTCSMLCEVGQPWVSEFERLIAAQGLDLVTIGIPEEPWIITVKGDR